SEKSWLSGPLSCPMAAANIRSKNNSVQLGRRMCRSCSGQLSGLRNNRHIAATTIEPAGLALSTTASPGFNSGSSACSSDLGNVLILLWRVTADSDSANDFSFENDGNATLQSRRTGQGQRGYATLADLIFKHFARPVENCRRPRFADSNLYAGNLGVVE